LTLHRRNAKRDAPIQTRIVLDWPPKVLNPNVNRHWGEKARVKARYKSDCQILARTQGVRKIEEDKLDVSVIFTPPDNRLRDQDNMIASFKSGQDGIADLIGVDDQHWDMSYAFLPPSVPGSVTVVISPKGASV